MGTAPPICETRRGCPVFLRRKSAVVCLLHRLDRGVRHFGGPLGNHDARALVFDHLEPVAEASVLPAFGRCARQDPVGRAQPRPAFATRHCSCRRLLVRRRTHVRVGCSRQGYFLYEEANMAQDQTQSCIEACDRCAQQCERGVNECLKDQNVKMLSDCIRQQQDCAEICRTTSSFLSRGSQSSHDICRVAAEICDTCCTELEKQSQRDCCRQSLNACRRCADECRQLAGVSV